MNKEVKTRDFAHPELNVQVTAIGGSYFLIKEERMAFNGEEILYLVGTAIFDTTCCGVGGAAYASVPGFLVQWKYKADGDGSPVSEVRPIKEERMQKKIRSLIMKKEFVHQVDFM